MMKNNPVREPYIDFMRALGLILLIGVHVNAPYWYIQLRTFDVPLMVVISAICYKPLRGGYFQYFQKRFKRIYIPVFVFLTMFFILSFITQVIIGYPDWNLTTIAGSYLLLNGPSIGYVWIMRVFLLMAIIMPLLDYIMRNTSFMTFIIILFGLIALNHPITMAIDSISDSMIRFGIDEIIPYAVGYSALAVLGLRLSKLTRSQLLVVIIITGVAIIVFIGMNDGKFNPQNYKYPPQSLYLLYGIFASTFLWFLKPLMKEFIDNRFFAYLSSQSMWLYLWHIIPVYLLTPWMEVKGLWPIRYIVVLVFAILLNKIYQIVITKLPKNVARFLK